MKFHFYKYHGTGNDFILLDNRAGDIKLTTQQVTALCKTHFGIGADGLMLLEQAPGADFRMVYYNADGGESTMCGNGGRCITAFARALGIIDKEASFIAIDGLHNASINEEGTISLEMIDVQGIRQFPGFAILNTGSPHYIQWVDNVDDVNVKQAGSTIRYDDQFAPGGVNVNFVQRIADRTLKVRTYERGVEDETLSCGTGVTAAAIAASGDITGTFEWTIQTPGGQLTVLFTKDTPDTARNVILRGPAVAVFEGDITI
jgi:diaminopimelate epimerase